MRIHCKTVVIAICFGFVLLWYFWGGKQDKNSSSSVNIDYNVGVKLVRKSPTVFLVGVDETPKRPKKSKMTNGGAKLNAKSKPQRNTGGRLTKHKRAEEVMHLAVVACGNRLEEALTLVKSAVLFSLKKIKFHIFAEDRLTPRFQEKLSGWPGFVKAKFQYDFYPITFPVQNNKEWKKLFKPCAAQRLFLPGILKDVDSLLYVDTDVVFLRPADDIWDLLKSFNGTQLAAMASEHEIPKLSWYSGFARHPFYGFSGLNSGVFLMNLTRIRRTLFKNSLIAGGLSWENLLYPLYQKYKIYIPWGDQDLLNIIFHYNPECVFALPCQWNYRSDHCTYGSNCQGAEEEGVSILHGHRRVYHNNKEPALRVVYETICDFPFEDKTLQSLFYLMQTKLLYTVNTQCGRLHQLFLKQMEKNMRKGF
uniref:glucoside xylosyltransferase 2-like n=1 Tax=Doryrhamphus excisus TaxID=161450 RepID=UPI0025AE0E70|nr:glucoside xylosyltransferase 2-like [Doryrhamphus excisus]